ncbi:Serine protease trypsin-like protein [Phytophthora megakarya]|uniref:Serine protease trypsin-like protein n=1 Tax=Phytophthora megakarya TaxID=4795 RepID=A0A225UMQ5_9STRA|nr:Serine protease trypsin-like protein [Phytophthora megakarya]
MLASTSTVAVERELIVSGEIVPSVTKTYVACLRMTTVLWRFTHYPPPSTHSPLRTARIPLHVGVRSENTTKMELNSGFLLVGSAIIPCIDSELGNQAVIVGSGEGDDVLIGASSWIKESCGVEGYYNVYARVSSVRAWIETITNGSCRP